MENCEYLYATFILVIRLSIFHPRNIPDGAEPEIISTIKKTFNFGQSEAVHLFQTLLECMKKKELVSKSLCSTVCPFITSNFIVKAVYGTMSLVSKHL